MSILLTLLAVLCWGILNVLDSMLVRHFESRPLVISCVQACVSVPILLAIPLFFPVQNDWIPWLLLVGVGSYVGDLLFWRLFSLVDASMTNFVGAFVAMLMIGVGVIVFHESFTALDALGSLCILAGIAVFSCSRQRTVSMGAFPFMLLIALFFIPFNIVQKLQEIDGQSVISTYFWLMLPRELCAVVVSFSLPSVRRQFLSSVPRQPPVFFILNVLSILLFLVAMFCIGAAYRIGSTSLVSVVANIQPFVVILLSWLMAVTLPRYAPRELLSSRSLQAKVTSFAFAFIGLALLASHQ